MVSSCRGYTARTSLYDLAYADDTAIFIGAAERGQQILHMLQEAAAQARQPVPELEKSVLLRSTTASNHIQFLTGEGMKTATQAKYLGVMLWSDSPSKTGVITRLATYNAMFVPMLSYGMESAALTAAHLDRLEATHSHPPGTVKVVWPCIWEQPQATWKGTVFLRRRCLQGWYCKVMDKAVPE